MGGRGAEVLGYTVLYPCRPQEHITVNIQIFDIFPFHGVFRFKAFYSEFQVYIETSYSV